MFIESLTVYAEYYDLLDNTNIYLANKNSNNKFNFEYVSPKHLTPIYENLGRAYDDLDLIKSRME